MNTKFLRTLKVSLLLMISAAVLGVFSFASFLTYAEQSQPNLWEALGADKTQVTPGEEFQYTIQIQNRDTVTFTNVNAKPFTFPSEVDYIAGSSQAVKNGQSIALIDNWINTGTNIGNLTPNQIVYIKYKVKVKTTVAVGTTITHAAQVKADTVPWSAVQFTNTVVSSNETATFAGNFLSVANVTTGNDGWHTDGVNADDRNVVEFRTTIHNTGSFDARNVKIQAHLTPKEQAGTTIHPSVSLSADNAPTVSDDVFVTAPTAAWLYPYLGHSKKFGDTGLYDCTPSPSDPQGGCLIPEQFYSSPMNIGTVHAGESKTIQIIFKSSLILLATSTPTPSPTPTITPTPTPTISPSPTPTVTPTPTPGLCNSRCSVDTDCASGYVCYVGYCRLQQHPASDTCSVPTPTPTPSPTPTATPLPDTKLKICKYEDSNGNGTVDSGEGKISWDFRVKINNDPEQVDTAHWWNIFSQGCVTVSVPSNKTIAVGEVLKDGWRQTGLYVDGSKFDDIIYMYTSKSDVIKVVWFLNTHAPQPTPTPTPTVSPTPTVTPSPTPNICVINNISVVPSPVTSDWNTTGAFTVKNTGTTATTFNWFLDAWSDNALDKKGTLTLKPGESKELGLGKICSKWQLDIGCPPKYDDKGYVVESHTAACVTPTPTVSPSPTPTPTPSPTPTPQGSLRICKFEDTNGNKVQDNGEQGLKWSFAYRLNDGNDVDYQTKTKSWYQFWKSNNGCGDSIALPAGTQVKVSEKMQSGWNATTDATQSATIRSGVETVLKFGNRKNVQPTPTPSTSPSPTPTPLSCNATCNVDSDCQSGYVCHADGSVKYCRRPENVDSTSCDTRKTGGFFIRKYNDENGNGYQDTSEKGISWKFQWDSNADNNWHDYETFESHLGEGGVVTLPEGTQVRIREKSVDGWTATTATEVTIHITAGNNQMMVFGNWRGKPQVLGATTPKTLPATGFTTAIGGMSSMLMYGIGIWLKKKGL